MKRNYRELRFRLIQEEDGYGVYFCMNDGQIYTKSRRYEVIIEFNPVLMEEDEKEYRKIYWANVARDLYNPRSRRPMPVVRRIQNIP